MVIYHSVKSRVNFIRTFPVSHKPHSGNHCGPPVMRKSNFAGSFQHYLPEMYAGLESLFERN